MVYSVHRNIYTVKDTVATNFDRRPFELASSPAIDLELLQV